ncbi:site-specific integrase [uncultured Limosilactobacillus sp.]|uniref:site-specific integrase n=1 Tax=uncultured Limosilactobacillus sp. TaxID=2837629 RepID=UPI0025DD69EF|nr:site-specific integrase [uncultured Limosilactobacillus sp.]
MNSKMLFYQYYKSWIHQYKEGAVRKVTFEKYQLVLKELTIRIPHIRLCDLDHFTYQKLINDYALTHERLTVRDFHHHCKSALMDALEDGLIDKDPTRHLILKGKDPRPKKIKYLSLLELKKLILQFKLGQEINMDWLLLLIAKTGMRYAEALGVTPADFDFENEMLSINKTWDYKSQRGHFQPTKNKSSVRVIKLDTITCEQFQKLIADVPDDQPIFLYNNKKIYTSTVNYHLRKYCKLAQIPIISVHGLRHTHASLLIYDGVSIPSVSKRLGHANTITTQNTYLHVVKELEVKDNYKIIENMIRLA